MNGKNVENHSDKETVTPKPTTPEWFDTYKQKKLEREAEDTVEMEIPEENLPDSK
jgi:hypothetical protein